jgi:hypothetical protein
MVIFIDEKALLAEGFLFGNLSRNRNYLLSTLKTLIFSVVG